MSQTTCPGWPDRLETLLWSCRWRRLPVRSDTQPWPCPRPRRPSPACCSAARGRTTSCTAPGTPTCAAEGERKTSRQQRAQCEAMSSMCGEFPRSGTTKARFISSYVQRMCAVELMFLTAEEAAENKAERKIFTPSPLNMTSFSKGQP